MKNLLSYFKELRLIASGQKVFFLLLGYCRFILIIYQDHQVNQSSFFFGRLKEGSV